MNLSSRSGGKSSMVKLGPRQPLHRLVRRRETRMVDTLFSGTTQGIAIHRSHVAQVALGRSVPPFDSDHRITGRLGTISPSPMQSAADGVGYRPEPITMAQHKANTPLLEYGVDRREARPDSGPPVLALTLALKT